MIQIVLAEDDVQERRLYKKFLKNDNLTVYEAESGSEAIRIVKEKKADILITDILMPGMNGLEVIASLKQDLPEIKVIAISGGNIAMDPADGLKLASTLGAVQILRKPFTREALKEAVSGIVIMKA